MPLLLNDKLAMASATIAVALLWYCLSRCLRTTTLDCLPQPLGGRRFPVYHYGAVISQPLGAEFLSMTDSTPNDGLIMLKCLFGERRLLLTSPKALSEVLVKREADFVKPNTARFFLQRLIGDGLLSLERQIHRHHRKVISRAFQPRQIKGVYSTMWSKCVTLVECLQEETLQNINPDTGSATINFTSWASRVSLDIIGLTIMNHDFDTLHNHKHQLIQHYDVVFEPSLAKRIFLQVNMLLPQRLIMQIPTRLNRFMNEGPGYLHDLCRSFVARRKDQLKHHDVTDGRLNDLLSIMIRSRELEGQGIIDQRRTFLSVGHDTTASSISWAIYLLCKNPSIKARLYAELDEDGPYDELNVCQKLESLPLLNAVCNETLRLYPALPITVREAACQTMILDTVVPKGTWVIMSPWAINRSRAIWGDRANDFRPDAWLTTEQETGKVHVNNHGGASHAFSQITFLHGPRICIGEKFARAELRCQVAAMVLHFDFELLNPDEDQVHAGVFTARPSGGVILKLKQRRQN